MVVDQAIGQRARHRAGPHSDSGADLDASHDWSCMGTHVLDRSSNGTRWRQSPSSTGTGSRYARTRVHRIRSVGHHRNPCVVADTPGLLPDRLEPLNSIPARRRDPSPDSYGLLILLRRRRLSGGLVGAAETGRLPDGGSVQALASGRRRAFWVFSAILLVAVVALAALIPLAIARGGVYDITRLRVESVEVSAAFVHITGMTLDSGPHYRGRQSDVSAVVMTIRLRYSIWGSGTGAFDERIPTGGERITRVVLTDGTHSRQVYP